MREGEGGEKGWVGGGWYLEEVHGVGAEGQGPLVALDALLACTHDRRAGGRVRTTRAQQQDVPSVCLIIICMARRAGLGR